MGYENRGKVKKDELKKLYIDQNMNLTQIGDYYDISASAVCRYVRRYGFLKNVSGRKNIWKDKFDEQDIDFIYMMGFVYADGCVVKNGRSYTLHLTLAKQDYDHLILLSNIFPYNLKIYHHKKTGSVQDQYGFQINGMDLFDILSKYGVIPRKSYEWLEPQVPNGLIKHFLRGWFDGDGCVYTFNQKYIKLSLCGNIYGMRYFLKSLENLGYNGSCHIKEVNNFFGRLSISNINDCKIFYDLLNDNFRLERKWSKIENILKLRNKL